MQATCNRTGEPLKHPPGQHTYSYLVTGRTPGAFLPRFCNVDVQAAAVDVFAVQGIDRRLPLGVDTPLLLNVQENREVFGHKHCRHLPVVELNAITVPGANLPRKAVAAGLKVAGRGFMSVDDESIDPSEHV